MGETRVDLLHLLEDIRDAYVGAIEETILTEMIANALDSGASRVLITVDATQGTLTVVDDGIGMQRRQLARFHDIAASTKTRGEGIGFAGVGIKLGLLVSEEVRTETRRGKTHVASAWRLGSRHRAPWHWMTPAGRVAERGTAVELQVRNRLSALLDAGFVEATLRRHFHPLLDPAFAPVLSAHYPRGVRLEVNARVLAAEPPAGDVAPLTIRVGRQRKPSAVGWLFRSAESLPEDQRGVGLSTFGKVIRNGWDWLGITPVTPDRIGGLLEVPALAECLTLNKADFVRTGARGSVYLGYRKAIQEVVAQQLAVWGDARDPSDQAQRKVARPLERELERVVEALADAFPLLSALVGPRPGGQVRLPMPRARTADSGRALVSAALTSSRQPSDEPAAEQPAPSKPAPPLGNEGVMPDVAPAPAPRRAARYGLEIQLEDLPDADEPARLVESTVWINTAHPAYRRAVASRAEGYHVALAAALALARVAVEPAEEHAFLVSFLSEWGSALTVARAGKRAAR